MHRYNYKYANNLILNNNPNLHNIKIPKMFKPILSKMKNFLKIQQVNKNRYRNISIVLVVLLSGGYVYLTGRNLGMQHNFNKFITRTTGDIGQWYIPIFMRQYVYGKYAQRYGVNLQEMQKDLKQYQNFSQFFTRKIKNRPYLQQQINNNNIISSPCDGQILTISKIQKNENILIKNITYSLSNLLFETKDNNDIVNKIKVHNDNQLYQIVIYLKPGDYHRFHAPFNLNVYKVNQIKGEYKPVNLQFIIKNNQSVYQKNARKVMHGGYTVKKNVQKQIEVKGKGKNIKKIKEIQVISQNRYLGLVFVGALNVANIIIDDKKYFKKGQQIGYFNLGSTIIMLLQSKANTNWQKKPGDKVKFGEKLCSTD